MNGPVYSQEIVRLLKLQFPRAACELNYSNPWELLVATILSAQCTDERVNQVTPELFRRWPGPAELAGAARHEVEGVIRPTGFFRNKARAIEGCARALLAGHEGKVPRDLEAMLQLPGVGRKTANVVLGEAYRIPAGIAVDTHVTRVSRRLGLSRHTTPAKIEADLEAIFPREQWVDISMRLVLLGRRICTARKPRCEACRLAPSCPRIGLP